MLGFKKSIYSLTLTFFLFSSQANAMFMANTLNSKQCYDLMMILDSLEREKLASKNQTMGLNFIASLIQKSFPILVSRHIVYNVCAQALMNSSDQKNILAQHTQISNSLFYSQNLLYQLNLTNNDWYCYDYSESNLMLFVPKNYAAQFAANDSNSDEAIKACGFDTTHLKKLETFSPKTLVPYLEKTQRPTVPAIKAIESMFIIPHESPLHSWNIYLTGHGMTNTTIAGLKKEDFLLLLAHFQKINCSFLHYNSCYSGGYNQKIVTDQLSQLNSDFIVSAQGINEDITYSPDLPTKNSEQSFTHFFKITESFFGNPAHFVNQNRGTKSLIKDPIAAIVNTVTNKTFLDFTQPFVYIPAAGVFNAFAVDKSVKIITNSLVKAHEFENKTMDFTDPAIKSIVVYPHYIGIPMKIKAHTAIISPVRSSSSFQEQYVATPSSASVHIFEKLIYEDTLSSVIPNLVSFNKKKGFTLFAIKELQCFDYEKSGLGNDYKNLISLKNVIIYSSFDDHMVTADFNFNEKTYRLKTDTFGKDAYPTSEALFEKFKNMPAIDIHQQASSPINDLLYDLMLAEILNYLQQKTSLSFEKGAYKSLADIITLLASTIDTTTHVQKPGSLQKILLEKQQDPQWPKKAATKPKPSNNGSTWSDYFKQKLDVIYPTSSPDSEIKLQKKR